MSLAVNPCSGRAKYAVDPLSNVSLFGSLCPSTVIPSEACPFRLPPPKTVNSDSYERPSPPARASSLLSIIKSSSRTLGALLGSVSRADVEEKEARYRRAVEVVREASSRDRRGAAIADTCPLGAFAVCAGPCDGRIEMRRLGIEFGPRLLEESEPSMGSICVGIRGISYTVRDAYKRTIATALQPLLPAASTLCVE